MRNKKLTLIELIIVVLVLGLLMGLAIPQFTGVKANADVASFKNDIDVLTKAIDESYVKEDNFPLGEKVTITDPALLDVIYASGDSATNLYKVDLSKTSKYHSKLKSINDANNYFIYSKETGKVFYTKGLVDGESKTLYTLEYVGLSNAKLGADPLINGMSVPVTEPAQTITGSVPVSSTIEVKVNGTDLPVIVDDVVFEGDMDLMAAAKTKTFTSEAVLSTGMNVITIKVDSQVTNFKINLGENGAPAVPDTLVIKPIAVISMTPEQGLTTATNIAWGTESSITAQGRTIINAEWEGKQDIYTTEGVYTVRLRVQDSTGAWSDWAEKVITVISMNGVIDIAAGSNHTIILMDNGTVMSFGLNYYGQLGRTTNNGTNNANPVPTTIEGVSGVKSIAGGDNCTLLLMENGTVMSFGLNVYGGLGRPANSTTNSVPTTILGVSGVKSIEAGGNHTLLLMENGTVMSFGYNNYGQLGKSANSTPNPTPTLILGISGVKNIAAGYNYSLLLMENGTVMGFGLNKYGQLGRTANTNSNPTPTLIPGITSVRSISAGGNHTLLLMENGTVMSFGYNYSGQLGRVVNNRTNTPNPIPTLISGVTDVKNIEAGVEYSLLLMENGSVMSFGSNVYGELGRGASGSNPNPIPTLILGITGVKNIETGNYHTILNLENGVTLTFGINNYGQLGILTNSGAANPNPTPTEISLEK